MFWKLVIGGLLIPLALNTIQAHGEKHEHADEKHTEHSHTHHDHSSQQPNAKLSVLKIEDLGTQEKVTIKLSKIKDDSPITPDELKELHTQKVHLLIIDDSLTDYHHIHPKPTNTAGTYEFKWNPAKKNAHYRIWADIFLLDSGAQEYAIADFPVAPKGYESKEKSQINRTVSHQATVDGLTFTLTFDNPLEVGKPSLGTIKVLDEKGNPMNELEPIMGAFAHIVGFSDDFKSVVHIHPMGEEPSKETSRGGPNLQFHIEPGQAGFIKLYAQVKVKGKEIFAPFGIVVRSAQDSE